MNTDPTFEQIYTELYPQIRRFLIARLGSEADAEDVTQDAFIKFQKAAQTEAIDNTKAYLFSIARNLSVDLIRRNTRAKTRESAYSDVRIDRAGDDLVDPTPTAEQEVSGREEFARVLTALVTLSPKVRQTFVLHKIDGHPHAEVARLMGISKSTVEKHMIKALRRLSEVLQ